jgi:hypothetical protein
MLDDEARHSNRGSTSIETDPSAMNTLDLKAAARFLHLHPVTVSRLAKAGRLPGAKPGKCWVFLDVDLADWLRAKYAVQASQGDFVERRLAICHSSDAKTRRTGGSISEPRLDAEYSRALGLRTDGEHRSTTTVSRRRSGIRRG